MLQTEEGGVGVRWHHTVKSVTSEELSQKTHSLSIYPWLALSALKGNWEVYSLNKLHFE